MLSGAEVEALDDDQLEAAILTTTVFARISPDQKSRIIKVARRTGKDVAFLGDGVNDAVALHHADVGISVDSGTDVAKDAADVVLLDKDLGVLAEGVMEGRRIFANTMKYVLMATSSNFGNMFSAAGASVFLSFLPMLPVADPPQQPALQHRPAGDPDRPGRPRGAGPASGVGHEASSAASCPCSGRSARSSTSSPSGSCSRVLHAGHTEFRTGWFVESIATQTLVVYVIRTRRVPFFKSRPSLPMLLVPTGAALVGAILPYTGLATLLGFTPLPTTFFLHPVRDGRRLPVARRAGQDPLLPCPPRPNAAASIHPYRTARAAHPAAGVPLHPAPNPMVRGGEWTQDSGVADERYQLKTTLSPRPLECDCIKLPPRGGGVRANDAPIDVKGRWSEEGVELPGHIALEAAHGLQLG